MSEWRHSSLIAAEIAAAIMAAPQSLTNVCHRVGIESKHAERARKYIEQFRESGCVYISDVTPRGCPIYSWQPSLFEHKDVPVVKPESFEPPRARQRKRRRIDLSDKYVSLDA